MSVHFSIPGAPTAKGRAKVTTIGGHARMYTPTRTLNYESKVALFAAQAMKGLDLFDGPLTLGLVLTMAIPSSWSIKKRELALSGGIIPTVKPDCSNVLKAVEDAMNGIVYFDDKQIADLRVSKRYGEIPSVLVTVEALA